MLLDAYHSNFHELQTIQRVEYGTRWANPATPVTNEGEIIDGRIQAGTFNDVPFVVIENYNNDRHAKIDSFGLNTDFNPNEQWNLNADISYSKVKRADLRLESTAGSGKVGDAGFPSANQNVTLTTGSDGRSYLTPTLRYDDYGVVQLSDPGSWGGGTRRSGFVGYPEINDEIKAIRLSAKRKFEGRCRGELRRELRRSHEAEGPVPEPALSTGQRLARDRAGAVPHGRRERQVLRLPNGVIGYDAIGCGTAASGSRSTRRTIRTPHRRSHLRRDERVDGQREADDGVREGEHRSHSASCRSRATSACRRAGRPGSLVATSTATPRQPVPRRHYRTKARSTPTSCRA
jgi:iron complex outermembrane receptor protein